MKLKIFFLLFLATTACSKHETQNSSFTENNTNQGAKKADSVEEKILLAMSKGDKATFIQILADNPNLINTPLSNGQSLLIVATLQDSALFIKELISQGADVAFVDNEGKTALMHAQEKKLASALLILDDSSALVEQNALFQAVVDKAQLTVDAKLKSGVNPNFIHESGETPLTQAITLGFIPIAKTLLQFPITDVNFPNAAGKTPLALARELKSKKPLIDALIAAKAQE